MKTKDKPIAYDKHVYTMMQRHDVNLEKSNYEHFISLKKGCRKTERKWTLHIIMLRYAEKQEQNKYTTQHTNMYIKGVQHTCTYQYLYLSIYLHVHKKKEKIHYNIQN